VVDINGCTASSDLPVKVLFKMHIPSAFTPNRDGKNDVFRIPPGSSISLQQLTVFDRWGKLIFKTSDVSKGWDGTYRGHDLSSGVYIYIIKGTLQGKEVFEKGTVTLLR
jgi:gliding motility-associated-like protein